jgi:hypothetical protein
MNSVPYVLLTNIMALKLNEVTDMMTKQLRCWHTSLSQSDDTGTQNEAAATLLGGGYTVASYVAMRSPRGQAM